MSDNAIETVTVRNAHGTFTASRAVADRIAEIHRTASIEELQARVQRELGFRPRFDIGFIDLIVMLASAEGAAG